MKKIIKFFSILLIASCAGQQPKNLGVKEGKLNDCPDKPNCVCSQGCDGKHKINHFTYKTTTPEALKKMLEIINSQKRTKIITRTDNYIHAEFKSKIMGFVDDVEFYFPEEKIIHVRSASRIGYSDMGVNRKRIEKIRKMFSMEEIK